MEDAATNRMRGMEVRGVNMGCCHMWDWASVCVYVWEEEPGSESVVSSVYMEKNNRFICRHYELTTSKEENLISYIRHCLLRKRQNSYDGCCWFLAISGGLCIFTYFSVCVCVCCSCCVSGDSHAGPLIENPVPRYSVIKKAKDREFHRSKWPLVSDNRASLAPPPLTTAAPQPTTPWSHARMREWMNLAHGNLLSDVAAHQWIAWISAPELLREIMELAFISKRLLLAMKCICSLSAASWIDMSFQKKSFQWIHLHGFGCFRNLRLIFNAPSDFQSKKLRLDLTHETCQGLQQAGWVLALALTSWDRKQNWHLLFQMFFLNTSNETHLHSAASKKHNQSLLSTQTDSDFAHNSSQGLARYLRYALLHSAIQLLSNLLESKSPDSHCTIHHVSFQFIVSGAAPGFISRWSPRLEACVCGF